MQMPDLHDSLAGRKSSVDRLAKRPRAVVVMGVSGCGKSTFGHALAARLHCKFLDADDFHPAANKAKMRAGVALNDDDRAPWLAQLNAVLVKNCLVGIDRDDFDKVAVVLACSALKARYRAALAQNIAVKFIYLEGTFAELNARLATRQHEYMPPTLLKSQLETLESPHLNECDFIAIPISLPIDAQVAFALSSGLSHNIGLGA